MMLPENLAKLVEKARSKTFSVGKFDFVSQDPNALAPEYFAGSVAAFLPQFILFWKALESVTGHRWKCTSYIRDSPSHRRGQAIDFAPEFSKDAEHLYAVHHNSDPVLYKREKLVKQLQKLVPIDFSMNGANRIGVFIEPDHLHVQVLAPGEKPFPTSIVKWKIAKPIYKDTYERMELPVIKN